MTDTQLKNAIEGVVIKWVHQVEEVFTQDTDDLQKDGIFPKPIDELQFWNERKENFSHIASQLQDRKVFKPKH